MWTCGFLMIVVIAISIIIYEYMDKVGIFWPATALERSLLMLLLIRIYERSGVVTDRHILAIRGMHNVLSIWQVLYLVSIAHKKAVDANFKQIMSLGRPLDLGDETTTQCNPYKNISQTMAPLNYVLHIYLNKPNKMNSCCITWWYFKVFVALS